MRLAQHDQMVQAFAPDGTNQPFDITRSAMGLVVRSGDRECPWLEVAG